MYLLKYISSFYRKFLRRLHSRSFLSMANCEGAVYVNGRGKLVDPQHLYIGPNVHIGDNYHIDARGKVSIGANAHISRNFVCHSANHNYEGEALPYDQTLIRKPIVIKENVWIGMNVKIVAGVTIGEGAIVGMGAVVTKDIPALSIVGGNPARVIKNRNQDHYDHLVAEQKYGGVNGRLIES